jgi:hypothetical protein
MRIIIILGLTAALLSACAPVPTTNFLASKKSALELREIQTRTVSLEADAAMRGVIATMHDLGYRITRVAPDARTVSGTRQSTLRLAVVVQPKGPEESAVRANASIMATNIEAQVDSPQFYRQNFFEPLGATIGREPALISAEDAAPEAPRPIGEINTAREREAAAKAAATQPQ